jgi:hypothetical protein
MMAKWYYIVFAHLFTYFLKFVYLLLRLVCSSVLPIFKLYYLHFYCWISGVLYIFWTLILIRYMICKYFLLFCGLSLYLLESALWWMKDFNLTKSNWSVLSFCWLYFLVSYLRIHCQT